MSQETVIKPSSEAYKLAESAALEEIKGERENQSLKQAWINLADQLEIEGFPKTRISSIGRQIIIEKKKEKLRTLNVSEEELEEVNVSGWFLSVMRDIGCTDKRFSSHELADTLPENSSINTPYYEENKKIIDLLHDTKEFYDDAISKLRTQPLVSLMDGQPKKDLELSIHDWKSHLKIARDIFNEKQKVPSNTIHILLHTLATESTINHATVAFFDHYKKILTLTPKQAGKYRKGIVTNMIKLFKPLTRDIAIFLNYYGLQCGQCRSWCVIEETDKGAKTSLKCLDCEYTFEAKTVAKCRYCQIPLYKDELLHIEKTWDDEENGGHCSNCNKINHLPTELRDYARA